MSGKNARTLHCAGDNSTKTLTAKEYNCLKHALPKSKIPRVLLHDNVTHTKTLSRYLGILQSRKNKSRNDQEQNIRTFVACQKKKQAKWKREDEFGIAGINLPLVTDLPKERPTSMCKLYTTPTYDIAEKPKVCVPLLPVMSMNRSKTEIVSHRDQTICAKLPLVVELDNNLMRRYDQYRGKLLLVPGGNAVTDRRFYNLTSSLSATKLEPDGEFMFRPATMPLPVTTKTRTLNSEMVTSRFFKRKTHSTK